MVMATVPQQGEVWWTEIEERRRPVLVVSRTRAMPSLHKVVVAPVTRTVRGIPTEVPVGRASGLAAEGVASFDNLTVVPRHRLSDFVGHIPYAGTQICDALAALADC